MQGYNLNPKIIEGINKQSNDENLKGFIKELLGIEVEKPNLYRWNKEYEKTLNKYCKEEGEAN